MVPLIGKYQESQWMQSIAIWSACKTVDFKQTRALHLETTYSDSVTLISKLPKIYGRALPIKQMSLDMLGGIS